MINLLSNAVKFSPEGGQVTVKAAVAADDYLEIKVENHGVGMSEEEIEIALKPFEQVDRDHARKHEGSGLGLPIVKGLVDLHSGALAIESEPGVGTIVIVRIPPDRLRPAGSNAEARLVSAD